MELIFSRPLYPSLTFHPIKELLHESPDKAGKSPSLQFFVDLATKHIAEIYEPTVESQCSSNVRNYQLLLAFQDFFYGNDSAYVTNNYELKTEEQIGVLASPPPNRQEPRRGGFLTKLKCNNAL